MAKKQPPKALADSGQVSAYRPAQKTKPRSMWQPIVSLLERFKPRHDPVETTEQGAAGSASPLTYYQTLWPQRYERLGYITDCELIMLEEPRLRRSILKYVNEACRGGFKLKVGADNAIGKRALEHAGRIEALFPVDVCEGLGRRALVTGDLFVQMIVGDGELVGAKAMPSAGMERLSDEADEIIDPSRAFAQVDTNSFQEVAVFPEALMCHVRWNHEPGARYGIPELIASRRSWRILRLMEESNAVSRMVRAPQTRLWNIGSAEQPGTQEDVDTFKSQNGMVEGQQEPWDPMRVARDHFGNGMITCEILQGDPFQEEIDDILHMQDLMVSTSPTPGVIFNLNAKDINRDVLKDVRSEWLKDTRHVNDILDKVIAFAFELSLMLDGIDPDLVEYQVVWTTSSIERPGEHIKSIVDMYQGGVISLRTALTQLRQYNQFEDIDAEEKAIIAEADLRETPWKNGNSTGRPGKKELAEKPSGPTNGKVTRNGKSNGGDAYDILAHVSDLTGDN